MNLINGKSYRRLKIDGEVPFEEAKAIPFDYSYRWTTDTFSDSKNNPYYIYLSQGEHTLTLETTLGDFSPLSIDLQEIISEIGDLYREIIMITGENPDSNRDYNLFGQIPDFEERLKSCSSRLEKAAALSEEISGEKGGSNASIMRNMANVMDMMLKYKYQAHNYQSTFYDNFSSISAWLYDTTNMPLDIDEIYLSAPENQPDDNKVGFFKKTLFSLKRLIASFATDYNNLSDTSENKEAITLWVNWGRDQVQILNHLIQSDFTTQKNIGVNIKMTNASLVQAILSGNGPDCYLHLSRTQPVNLAIRGAVYDLTKFDDYEEVVDRFMPSASIPYAYNNGVYALPDTQTFYMLFYREDILKEYGLSVPTTWDEFIQVSAVLMRNNLQVGLPYTQITNMSQIDLGTGALNLFPTLLEQKGKNIYTDDLKGVDFLSKEAITAFTMLTDFYSEYSFPKSYDFYNRFRAGLMPMAVQNYTMYSTLKNAASEIDGLWKMAPIPGELRDKYFIFVTYGDIKYSIGNLVLSENGETKAYSFENMKNMPTGGNYRNSANLYTETPLETTHLFPTVKVSISTVSSYLTLDATDATYMSAHSEDVAYINGIKIGTEQGVNLEAGQNYTVSFDYRLEVISRPSDDKPLNKNIYDCRTPVVRVYKDGINPVNALSPETQGTTGVTISSKGTVNPWNMTLGEWYEFLFTFKTADEISGDTFFALVSYGAMKASYKELKITKDNTTQTFELGKIFNYEFLHSDVYCDDYADTTSIFPEIEIYTSLSVPAGDANGDNVVDILDLFILKKYFAGVEQMAINNGANCDMLEIIDDRDIKILRSNILGSVAYPTNHSDTTVVVDNTSPVQESFLGFNAISQGFFYMPNKYVDNYTNKEIEAELDRIQSTGVKNVRTYYDQGFAAEFDSDGNVIKNSDGSIKWNWETEYMKGFYKWLEAMKKREIDVILNLSWGTYILGDDTIFKQQNPFAGMTVAEVTEAYADWAAKSVKELIVNRGYDNIKYVLPFTEPYVGITLTGKKVSDVNPEDMRPGEEINQTDWYPQAVKALNEDLSSANLRQLVKIIGPNVALRDDVYNSNSTLEGRIQWWTDKIDSYIDIYSFHWYAPAYPEYDGVQNNIYDENTYDLQSGYLERITPIIKATGKEMWFDELNYFAAVNNGNLHDNVQMGFSGTQLAQMVIANMNAGLQNNLLWSLNDMQWPLRNGTSGEYTDGVHMTGVYPVMRKSHVPYKQYYAYTLFSKYLTDASPMKTYKAVNGNKLYATMVKLQDGNISIAVVNATNREASFDLKTKLSLSENGVTFYRYLYDPNKIIPTSKAEIIKKDKTFSNVKRHISDIIPAGGVAVYTTVE